MIKFNKSTLTELAGLGAGSAASAYVKQKVLVKEDGSSLFGAGRTGALLTDIAPIAVGLAMQGVKGTFAKEAGKGMIAESVGSLIKANVPQLGITGMDPMIGEMEGDSDAGDFSTNEPLINGTGYDYSERETDF
jgi:hypothetical protein